MPLNAVILLWKEDSSSLSQAAKSVTVSPNSKNESSRTNYERLPPSTAGISLTLSLF